MKLNLTERLNEDEITEIRKRAFSFAEQMFMQGVSVGRELNREDMYNQTETYIKDKISAMTAYFVRDDIWEAMPPRGYNPNPNVGVPNPSTQFKATMDDAINRAAAGPTHSVNMNATTTEEKPEWADKPRPFN
jgi:hypothetical protein